MMHRPSTTCPAAFQPSRRGRPARHSGGRGSLAPLADPARAQKFCAMSWDQVWPRRSALDGCVWLERREIPTSLVVVSSTLFLRDFLRFPGWETRPYFASRSSCVSWARRGSCLCFTPFCVLGMEMRLSVAVSGVRQAVWQRFTIILAMQPTTTVAQVSLTSLPCPKYFPQNLYIHLACPHRISDTLFHR